MSALVAVCGQHMEGLELHYQLQELKAKLVERTTTAPCYRLFALPTSPIKPGLLRWEEGGEAIEVEIYELSTKAFGKFVLSVPSPLGFGKLTLQDGRLVEGFLCEPFAILGANGKLLPGVKEITHLGSFRKYLTAL